MLDNESFIKSIGRAGRTNSPETISFNSYFSRCITDPKLTRNSVQRIYDMIMSHGTTTDEVGRIKYNFFKGRMFGSDEPIEMIMEYFKAASYGLDIKKRVLLLLGPPGGGKSMFLTMLKEGLRDYSKTEAGAMYRIKGCPMNEDPMNLIEDESIRRDIWNKYQIKIDNKLCPMCKFTLETEWKNNLSNVKVERFNIDEETRTGVGTFAPSESNDMAELYGSVNTRKFEEIGNESDPRVYDFTGELQKANRGIMEFIEVLKANPSFLHVLLTLAEEEQFKTPRFPLISVDEALIAHTNEGEFDKFISVRENEAIVDRLYIVRMPYNMHVENEELIYHSALKNKLLIDGIKIHPGAIRLASEFVVYTRGVTSNDKGNRVDVDKVESREVISDYREGMHGLSPRFVLNALALSLIKIPIGATVVRPQEMLITLFGLISNYPVLTPEEKTLYLSWLRDYYKSNSKMLNELTERDVALNELNQRVSDGSSLF